MIYRNYKTKEIYNKNLANYLLDNECTILQIKDNKNQKGKLVFIFKDEPNFQYFFNQYMQENNK